MLLALERPLELSPIKIPLKLDIRLGIPCYNEATITLRQKPYIETLGDINA